VVEGAINYTGRQNMSYKPTLSIFSWKEFFVVQCNQSLQIYQTLLNYMSSSSERKRDEQEKRPMMPARQFDSFFDSFRREMERMMTRPWSFPMDMEFPSLFETRDMRMALYELVDRGDKFEVQLEVPGIEKENVDVKATKYSIEISGKHSEKSEERNKRYVYSERLYRSFYRNVPLPEEIIPSKVSAKVDNGILRLDLPKKNPRESESEATRIEVK
jgi:HSP20 family protein